MIPKTTPIEDLTFDKWQIASLNISRRSGKTSAAVTLVPTTSDGEHQLADPLTIQIPDVHAETAQHPQLGVALAAVYAAVAAIGTTRGAF